VTAVDLFRAAIRWLHVLAAVGWVGGGIFYLFVLNQAWADPGVRQRSAEVRALIARRFRDFTGTCILTVVVTGVIITVDRLTDPRASVEYGALLALKLALVAFMYLVFRQLDDRKRPRRWASPETMLAAGVVVFLVTVVLRLVYEAALRAAASG
jgi:putative copper export protein